jgi:F-type H+-transporting ATPase subunit b
MENLGIDFKLILAQLINFGLFFFIYKKFVAKPFLGFINREKKNDEERQKTLVELASSKEKLEQEEKAKRAVLAKEIDEIYKKAKKEAGVVREDLVNQAHQEANTVLERGRKQTAEERTEMLKELKSRTGELSIFLINSALNEYFDEEAKKKITRYILDHSSQS